MLCKQTSGKVAFDTVRKVLLSCQHDHRSNWLCSDLAVSTEWASIIADLVLFSQAVKYLPLRDSVILLRKPDLKVCHVRLLLCNHCQDALL